MEDQWAGVSALIVAITGLAALFVNNISKRLEAKVAERKDSESTHMLSIEKAAGILERHVERLLAEVDRERARRVEIEKELERARDDCPMGADRCPLKERHVNG